MPYKDPYQKYLFDIKYRIENLERIKQQRKEHYQQTRKQQLLKCREYRQKHLEQCRAVCRRYREAHREQLNKDAKEYYATHREEQKENNRKYYVTHQKEVIKYRLRTREQRYATRKAFNLKLKLKAYEILGNKCSNPNCAVPGGMIDIRALQIDHINGGGTKEIRNIKEIGIYKKIIDGKKGYQILCANCNWLKRHTSNENGVLKELPKSKPLWQAHL
ncbi:MAG: hypothetical protein ABSB71_08070 [Candidatus Bathyarchaeia archaeon]|jgi:hypothetical protein